VLYFLCYYWTDLVSVVCNLIFVLIFWSAAWHLCVLRSRKRKDGESGVSRGIDFHNVSNIVNFDFPPDVDSYIHRVGRWVILVLFLVARSTQFGRGDSVRKVWNFFLFFKEMASKIKVVWLLLSSEEHRWLTFFLSVSVSLSLSLSPLLLSNYTTRMQIKYSSATDTHGCLKTWDKDNKEQTGLRYRPSAVCLYSIDIQLYIGNPITFPKNAAKADTIHGMQWRQRIWTYLWSDIYDAILCVRQIVYVNNNGVF